MGTRPVRNVQKSLWVAQRGGCPHLGVVAVEAEGVGEVKVVGTGKVSGRGSGGDGGSGSD